MSRKRGTGRIYRQPGCKTWSLKYYQNGKCIRESTGLTDYQAARQKLNQRLGKIANGEIVDVQLERVSVANLADETLRDYRVNGKKSLADAESRWKLHLNPVFGHLRVMHVTTQSLNLYVDQRKEQGCGKCNDQSRAGVPEEVFQFGIPQYSAKSSICPSVS